MGCAPPAPPPPVAPPLMSEIILPLFSCYFSRARRVYRILSEVGQRRFVYRKLSEVGHRTNGKRISEGWDRKWIADGLQADSKQKAIGSETDCKRMAEGQMFGKGKILRRIFLQRHHNSLEIISVIDEKKIYFLN